MKLKRSRFSDFLVVILVLLLAGAMVAPGTSEAADAVKAGETEEAKAAFEPIIGPRAGLILRAMSDYMKSVQQFSVRGKISFDDTLPTGQKIQYTQEKKLAIRRPDRAYGEAWGDLGNKRFWYDGKRTTLVDGTLGVYATVDDVPGELGALMDHLFEKYDFAPPLADLVYPDIYEAVIGNVQFGNYVGLHDVEGIRCHHLAFVTKYKDWQVWIEDGLQMVPRKFLITYKAQPESPQYQAILTDWDLDARLPDVLFKVETAAMANLDKIEFLSEVDLKDMSTDVDFKEMSKEKGAGHEADK
jgi:hypothetical protein